MGVTSYYSKFHKNKLNKLKLLTNLIISLSLNKSFPKCLDLRLRNFMILAHYFNLYLVRLWTIPFTKQLVGEAAM